MYFLTCFEYHILYCCIGNFTERKENVIYFLQHCCFQAQWYHQGGELLGRPWLRGDVLGCLVDMADRTMMVTLNGELLFNDRGSELAAKDFDIRDGRLSCFLRSIFELEWLDVFCMPSFFFHFGSMNSPCLFQACCLWSVLGWTNWDDWIWAAKWTLCSILMYVACKRALNPLPIIWVETQLCGWIGHSLSLLQYSMMITAHRWIQWSVGLLVLAAFWIDKIKTSFRPCVESGFECITLILKTMCKSPSRLLKSGAQQIPYPAWGCLSGCRLATVEGARWVFTASACPLNVLLYSEALQRRWFQ